MLLSLGLACIAVLGFGSSAVLARLGMQAMRPMPSALVSMVASTLLAGTLALIFELDAIIAMPAIAMVWLLGNGILSYIGGRSQQYVAISLIGASRVTPIVGSAAIFSAIYAITLTQIGVTGFDEHLNVPLGVGTIVVVVGLALTGGNFLRQSWGSDWHSVLGYVLAILAAACYGAGDTQREGAQHPVRVTVDHGGGQHVLRDAGVVTALCARGSTEIDQFRLGPAVCIPGRLRRGLRRDVAILRGYARGIEHPCPLTHCVVQPSGHSGSGSDIPAADRNRSPKNWSSAL